MQLRDYAFLGTTQSLCPECLALVPAKIIERDGRVYFRKRCPTHGLREDFICSDVTQYDRTEFSVPGRVPRQVGVEPNRGCPFDCGLCTEHEQHTCIGLVEITESCNLKCPMCYASSGPGGQHLSFEDCKRAIDRLVEVEHRAEVLQLSGGEPTIHPRFLDILEYACAQPIDIVMINTNGVRFARDDDFLHAVAEHRRRIEVYLQFDGFRESTYRSLRGEELVAMKRKVIDRLGEAGINVILVATLQAGVNEDEIGEIVTFGLQRPWITGVSFQPATYSGRYVLPEELEKRITFPDVIQAVVNQTDGVFEADDFMPLPCAHPNGHSLSYIYRAGGKTIPLSRFIDVKGNLDLLAGGITFTRGRARQLIERYLGKLGCCGGGDCGDAATSVSVKRQPRTPIISDGHGPSAHGNGHETNENASADVAAAARDFFDRAVSEQLSPADVFRITITSFMDAYNFDVRVLMQSCVHHVLPSGHVIPFSAYNVLYREGHVKLPVLQTLETAST